MEEQTKNREATKRRLIAAVGEILREEGYARLGVNRIARQAGVSKKLIYRYFGGLNYLIECYVVETDYWLSFTARLKEMNEFQGDKDLPKLISEILKNQFKYFLKDKEMQRLILWEISEKSPMMRSIHNVRESNGKEILAMTDKHFKGKPTDFRAIAALLVGGIYYIVLHIKFNGGMFCDINVNTEEGQQKILTAIDQVVTWSFDKYTSKINDNITINKG